MKVNKILISLMLLLVLCSCTSCEPDSSQIIDLLSFVDSIPPKLIKINSESLYAFSFTFDESLKDRYHTIVYFEEEETSNFSIKGKKLTLFSIKKLTPGKKYSLGVKVEDLAGNTTQIESESFAKNLNPAKLIITEISTKGTKKYGDRLELLCINSGCLAGITVANGFNSNYTERCVLPNVPVVEGDMIVIAFQSDVQCDYQSENLKGLSSNNGCILINENPEIDSRIQDCIIYSNKESLNYGGFANKHTLEVATQLMAKGEWEESKPEAESAMSTYFETSTRTINRRSRENGIFIDTNTQSDFYITVTGGQSFGERNNPNEYQRK